MSIITPATMQTISDALGAADALLLAQLVTTEEANGNTAADKLKLARLTCDEERTEDDLDSALTLVQALRRLETTVPSSTKGLLVNTVTALDTYVKAVTGQTLRAYFSASMAVYGSTHWSDNFRTLWRRVKSEELIVQVAHAVNASGTWTSYQGSGEDKTLDSETAMELRVKNTVTTGDIAVTITLEHTDGSTSLYSTTIPSGTAAGTKYTLKVSNKTKFSGVTSIAATGGGNTNRLEVWVL